ncbi:hypothetical protein F4560_002830 [Saccharothrix ecbatanensis]|uniref:Uncharacterized protein n=1 Tax=Saccharothrix ecbatanensis TaxID=1105145 RepID=A0A7W9HIR0_9PSEU|nr:hypothetical protein [Saccharothrix ecbatanensis]MBB5803062.1 hypothetical protein [Saccharothrix ecbatanensis]
MNRITRAVGLVAAGLLLSATHANAEPVNGRTGYDAVAGQVLTATCVMVVSPAGPVLTVYCPPRG